MQLQLINYGTSLKYNLNLVFHNQHHLMGQKPSFTYLSQTFF